jgi:hypothetical protein
MPRGDKSSYSDKQKRMAEHIEEGYEKRGVSDNEAERRAWATVNKETHGGKKERFRARERRRPFAVSQGWKARWRGLSPSLRRRSFRLREKGRQNAQDARRLVSIPGASGPPTTW